MAALPGCRGALQNAFHQLSQCNVSGALRPKTALRRVMRVDPTEKTPKAHSATARTATAGSGREIEAASEKLINGNALLR